jgi:hypothetical protein
MDHFRLGDSTSVALVNDEYWLHPIASVVKPKFWWLTPSQAASAAATTTGRCGEASGRRANGEQWPVDPCHDNIYQRMMMYIIVCICIYIYVCIVIVSYIYILCIYNYIIIHMTKRSYISKCNDGWYTTIIILANHIIISIIDFTVFGDCHHPISGNHNGPDQEIGWSEEWAHQFFSQRWRGHTNEHGEISSKNGTIFGWYNGIWTNKKIECSPMRYPDIYTVNK